jgi:dTDP-4-dehydrorhamnose 3,5-epimerase
VGDARIDDHGSDRAIPVPRRLTREPSHFDDVRLFERQVFRDTRGSFTELWRDEDSRMAGLPEFIQDNVARSRRGVVRGLHFQQPHPQAKLISVAAGEIFDVAVDVRVGSPTFGRWAAYTLSESNGRQLYVPAGYAHGYQTISDVSVVVYKCSDVYSPENERTIRFDDEDIAIPWPIPNVIVSPRDRAAPRLRDVLAQWLPQIEAR